MIETRTMHEVIEVVSMPGDMPHAVVRSFCLRSDEAVDYLANFRARYPLGQCVLRTFEYTGVG